MTTPPAPDHDGGWLGRADRWSRLHPLVVDVLTALVLAAVLGALTLSSMQDAEVRAPGLAAAALVLLHVSVAFRRSAVAAAFVMASIAMLGVLAVPNMLVSGTDTVQVEVPLLFMPSSLVYLLILYTAASRLPRQLSLLALLIAMTGTVLAGIRATGPLQDAYAGGWQAGALAAVVFAITALAAWSLGRLQVMRTRRAEAARREAARLAVLEERTRISRDIHDIVAHSLALIVRQAEGGSYVASKAPEKAAEALQTIADTGRTALNDMRGLLGVLRAGEHGDAGHAAAESLADVHALLEPVRDAGLAVDYAEAGTPFRVGQATELAAYRVVQEALTNAIKYAGPGATVHIRQNWSADGLTVEITDDGGVGGHSGADERSVVPGAKVGLTGLRERVSAAGGTFRAGAVDGGFQVRATFPRPAAKGGT